MVSSVYGGAFTTVIKTQALFNAMVSNIPNMKAINIWLYTDPMYGFKINSAIWYEAFIEWKVAAAVPPAPAVNRPINQLLAMYFKISYTEMDAYFTRNKVSLNAYITAAGSTINSFTCAAGTD